MRQSATPTDRPAARRRICKLLGLVLVLLTLALGLPASASAFVANGGGWFESLSGPVASAGECAPESSAQTLLARLALQQAQLTANYGAADDVFGRSVAISGDTALVGASGQDPAGKSSAGAAYVFVRSGGAWTQQAQLTAADGAASNLFGRSVAISGDTALVGAPWHAPEGKVKAGAAYVFVRSGSSWTQQAELIAADGAADDHFGHSVALVGETALVGAMWHNTAGNRAGGAAYVFVRSGSSWRQQAQLTAADGAAGDFFGYSVALTGDTALVGAATRNTAGKGYAGAAYVFTRSGGAWTQQAELTAVDGAAGDWFGFSVALTGDTALVGAPYHAAAGRAGASAAYVVDAGAAYVFTRSGSSWTQRAELTAADGAGGDEFGRSVAISGDTALVGASRQDPAGKSNAGAAYVFTRSGSSWTHRAELTADDGAYGDEFGDSAALSGETALVGAPSHATSGKVKAGAAYVFPLGPAPTLTLFTPASGPVGASVTLTGTGFTGASAVAFSAAAATFSVVSDTQLSATVPAGAASGPIAVTTPGGIATSPTSFIVTALPSITKLKPASAKRGALVTISGTEFGAAKGTSSVKFGSKTCTTYVSWSDTQIKCKVPTKAKYGRVSVIVTTAAGASSALRFTVKR